MKKLLTILILTVLILSQAPTAFAALKFNSATTNRVNYGSGSYLDNIATGTVLVWYKPDTMTSPKIIVSKHDDVSTGWNFNKFAATTIFRINIRTSGTTWTADSISTVMATSSWNFMGATWEASSNASNPIVYWGSLLQIARNVTASSVTGTGTFDNDSALNMFVGNNTAATTGSASGSIAWVGIWRRRLSLGEIRDQQFHPHPTEGNVLFTHLGFNGVTSVPDWSGKRNTGTVTGATTSPHVPIKIFGR